jgi:xylan 1,4-beta-xylosidase
VLFRSGQLSEARRRVRQSPSPDLPLHITEYNTAYTSFTPIHDTALNAAYLGRLLREGGEVVDSFSYRTFSDVLEEMDVPRSQFHGGFGLVAFGGIRKPTFHLFAFLRVWARGFYAATSA